MFAISLKFCCNRLFQYFSINSFPSIQYYQISFFNNHIFEKEISRFVIFKRCFEIIPFQFQIFPCTAFIISFHLTNSEMSKKNSSTILSCPNLFITARHRVKETIRKNTLYSEIIVSPASATPDKISLAI